MIDTEGKKDRREERGEKRRREGKRERRRNEKGAEIEEERRKEVPP